MGTFPFVDIRVQRPLRLYKFIQTCKFSVRLMLQESSILLMVIWEIGNVSYIIWGSIWHKISQQAQPDFTWLRCTLDQNKILYSVKSSLTGLKGAHCWTLLKVKFQREQIEDDEDPYINCTTLYSRSFFRKLQRTILSNYLIMAWRYYPWLVGLHGTFS